MMRFALPSFLRRRQSPLPGHPPVAVRERADPVPAPVAEEDATEPVPAPVPAASVVSAPEEEKAFASAAPSPKYISPEDAARLVVPGEDGKLPLRLVHEGAGRLVFKIDGHSGILPADRAVLGKHGIIAGHLRGVKYHLKAAKGSDFSPGTALTLIREPENPHDKNAVAVASSVDGKIAGYVNKQKAARLAKLLDAGIELVAIALEGEPPGTTGRITFAAADPSTMAHLLRS